MRTKATFFASLLLLILMALPLMAMPFRVDAGDSNDEFREPRPFPGLSWQTALRGEFAPAFEGWFSDHFGLREPLIRLNAWVRVKLLSTSPTEDVIVGRDGMLFFHETLPDYQDTQPLTDDELATIRANVSAIADALAERGAQLFLAIVPNKNSVYPESMPAAYPRREGDGNIPRLQNALSDLDVTQIDLLALLRNAPGRLYYLTDTHWNDAGARLAADALLTAMGRGPAPQDPPEATVYSGDLARMVGLKDILTEPSERLIRPDGHDYAEHLLTVDAEGEGHLLMLRDSFGVAIAPFLTPSYEQTQLRWQSPLEISGSPDDVLILIAERTIRQYLMEEPIILEPDEESDDDEDYEELQRLRAEMQQEEG